MYKMRAPTYERAPTGHAWALDGASGGPNPPHPRPCREQGALLQDTCRGHCARGDMGHLLTAEWELLYIRSRDTWEGLVGALRGRYIVPHLVIHKIKDYVV